MTPTFRQRMREIFAHDPSQSPAWLAFKAKEAGLKVIHATEPTDTRPTERTTR